VCARRSPGAPQRGYAHLFVAVWEMSRVARIVSAVQSWGAGARLITKTGEVGVAGAKEKIKAVSTAEVMVRVPVISKVFDTARPDAVVLVRRVREKVSCPAVCG